MSEPADQTIRNCLGVSGRQIAGSTDGPARLMCRQRVARSHRLCDLQCLNATYAPAEELWVGKKRTNPGRLGLYGEAWTFARQHWRVIVSGWVAAGILAAAALLLPCGEFAKGLLVGLLSATAIAWALAIVWVGGDFMPRLKGVWAEEGIGEDLDGTGNVLARIPSLRLDRIDIDHVVITRSAVLAIEVKRHGRSDKKQLQRDVDVTARSARTLRHLLKSRTVGRELGSVPAVAVLVNCGPTERNEPSTVVPTPLGAVQVVGGRNLRAWVEQQPPGPIGPDYAARLAEELEAMARIVDEQQADGPRVLRHVSRVR